MGFKTHAQDQIFSSGWLISSWIINEFEKHNIKNYPDLGQCYPPEPSASADNIDLDLGNSWYHAQPHPIIIWYFALHIWGRLWKSAVIVRISVKNFIQVTVYLHENFTLSGAFFVFIVIAFILKNTENSREWVLLK